ncbi:MAG: RDD family protein, partial [Bacteroidales bacterium]|nr:RDD family protein [Bacteroidales bacterium]
YIMSLFWWIYYASFHSSKWQASIGKRAMGLKVVDKYGNRISFGRATGRYFSMLLSTILLFIGYMMIGWNSHKQGLHDLIAKTYVIRSGRM